MKRNKYCVRVISALITIMLLFAVLPVSTALADTSGPNNAGAGTNVTGIGTSAWQNPGNITVPGAPFATAVLNKTSLITNYLQGTQYGFSIPTGSTITGIQVVINRQSDFHNPSIEDNVVSLVKGGTIVGNNKASGTVWPTSMMTATYGGATDLWGTTWTAAEINDPSFGVVLSAQRHNNGNNDRTASVDYMQITVYYSYGTSTTVDCGNGTPVVTYGDSLTCVATVTRLTSSGTPSGTVNWVSGGSGSFSSNSCTLAGSGGIATCSVSYTPSLVGSGSHLITATYGGDALFSPSSGNQPVTVYPKEASVTPDATGKTYGDADPLLTGTLAGFLDADGVEASYSRTSGETVAGNPYAITAVLSPTEVLSNYDITYNTADFTIDKRSIEVTADAQSKAYGDPDPGLTYQVTSGSLVFEDTFTGTLNRESGEDLGTYAINQDSLALTDDYDLTFIGADFTINKRSVEVTADAQSKEYGDSDPELTYQVTSGSLIPGDVFTGTLERQSGEDVGTYAITQGTLALTDNYDLSFFSADLTITLRPITVTADPQTKAYGDPDPVLTYQVTSGSLVPGDVFTGALYRELGEDVGMYAITQGSLALPVYYDLSYAGNYLTITGGIRVKLFLPIIIEQPH